MITCRLKQTIASLDIIASNLSTHVSDWRDREAFFLVEKAKALLEDELEQRHDTLPLPEPTFTMDDVPF